MAWAFGAGISDGVCRVVIEGRRSQVVEDGVLKMNLFKGAFLDGFTSNNVDRDNLDAASKDDVINLTTWGAFATATWHGRKRCGDTSADRHQW